MNTTVTEIVYPESDGKPMADNTLQWDWNAMLVTELRHLLAGQEVFVAGDLFWYPVEGKPKVVAAPDALVVFGRPAGHRGSYKQWREGGVPVHVTFEVLSPKNTPAEMPRKRTFYERYGVEEYYVLDPYAERYEGHLRDGDRLEPIPAGSRNGFVSPRLGVTFHSDESGFWLTGPTGQPFRKIEEQRRQLAADTRRAQADAKAAARRLKALTAMHRAETERLAAKLRELGIDPDTV
jgi:hypothetical protein